MSETISQDKAQENGCNHDVFVEVGEYGRSWGGDHVIQIVISKRHLYSRRELEWAALTLASAEELRDDLDNAISNVRKAQKAKDQP